MDSKIINRDAINHLIPQSPPFLFLDQVLDFTEQNLTAQYTFSADQDFFKGHFPTEPIVPGVLLCECCLQAGAVFLSLNQKEKITGKAIVTKMDKVKFKNFVKPNMILKIDVSVIDKISNYILMNGKITSDDKNIMSLEFMVGTV